MATLYTGDPATRAGGTLEAAVSAVSWPAIFAGAFVMAASALILIELGTGVGLTTISPWPNSGMSLTSFAITTAIWLIVVQWIASALGGYVAGRLRTRWIGTHTHEVFFRDTAQGFVTWSVVAVFGVLIAASAAGLTAGVGAHSAATLGSGAAQGAGGAMAQTRAYDVDTLFRSANPAPAAAGAPGASSTGTSTADARGEATRILATGLANGGDVPAGDRAYLATLVAARTGISKDEAQKRVDQAITAEKAAIEKARIAADKARKAAANLAIFLSLSMVVGAFIASVAASIGGQERDRHP
ncbi:MAG TPA: hypothetical protein VIJ42_16060 [Stellaceae bacterium]